MLGFILWVICFLTFPVITTLATLAWIGFILLAEFWIELQSIPTPAPVQQSAVRQPEPPQVSLKVSILACLSPIVFVILYMILGGL